MQEDILKYVNQIDLDKGLYYDSKKVKYVGNSYNLDNTKYRFIVTSESISNSYMVTVESNKKKEIINTFCTCPQFANTSSCKHLAAVLIKYQGEYFNILEDSFDNRVVDNLLSEIKTISEENKNILKEARVIPYLKMETSYKA